MSVADGRARRATWSGVRLVVVLVAVAAVGVGVFRIALTTDGIDERLEVIDGVPITLLDPQEVAGERAGVVIAHGFAGSRQLMRAWALMLADHGYTVTVPDLAGHGSNPAPLDAGGAVLVENVALAHRVLVEDAGIAPDRIALLGHSMGSGAVMRAAIEQPELAAAVIAVSPTDADVDAAAPRDLKLIAGSLEGRFVANAEDLLERAGGAAGVAGTDGSARDLQIIAGVEHVTVLFSPAAHTASLAWLDAVFGREAAPAANRQVMLAWLLVLAGIVALWRAMAPVLLATSPADPASAPDVSAGSSGTTSPVEHDRVPRHVTMLSGAAGAAGATALLAAVGAVLPIGEVGGMLVGPVLAVWFGLAGAIWLLGVRLWVGTTGIGRWESRRDLVGAALILMVLTLAFGLLAPLTWLPWFPSPHRALYVLPLAALVLPWTVPVFAGLRDRWGWGAVGWWAATSMLLVVGVGLAAFVVPGIGFVILLLPLLPPLLALVMAVATPWLRARRGPWGPAVAGAVFLGWTMAVLFPLVA